MGYKEKRVKVQTLEVSLLVLYHPWEEKVSHEEGNVVEVSVAKVSVVHKAVVVVVEDNVAAEEDNVDVVEEEGNVVVVELEEVYVVVVEEDSAAVEEEEDADI